MKLFTSFGLINKKVRAERETDRERRRHRDTERSLMYCCFIIVFKIRELKFFI